MLLDACPGALTERGGPHAQLPLHVAAAGGASGEVLSLLLSRHPEAARVPDSQHCLPLHHACERPADAETLAHLIAAHPEGLDTLSAGLRPLASWLRAIDVPARAEAATTFERLLLGNKAALRACVHDLAPHAAFAPLLGKATAADPTLPYVFEAQDAPGTPLEALQVACADCRRAMLANSYLLRRFALQARPFNVSAASQLVHATDMQAENSFHRRVVLKFCKRRDNFQGEARLSAAAASCSHCELERDTPLSGSAAYCAQVKWREKLGGHQSVAVKLVRRSVEQQRSVDVARPHGNVRQLTPLPPADSNVRRRFGPCVCRGGVCARHRPASVGARTRRLHARRGAFAAGGRQPGREGLEGACQRLTPCFCFSSGVPSALTWCWDSL